MVVLHRSVQDVAGRVNGYSKSFIVKKIMNLKKCGAFMPGA